MVDVAALGIKVTSDGVEKAKKDLDSLSKSADNAQKTTDKLTGSNSKAATALNNESAAAAKATAANNNLALSADRADLASKRMGGSMSGLAAQFQDIGVTAYMGMNPMMVALQQGTQIAGQMEMALQGGSKATSVLATAFRSLASPISLISIGLTAAATYAIQYFMESGDGAKASNEEIKKQNDLIISVAKSWGDATPALKAYADELERTAQFADLQSATRTAISGVVQELTSGFDGLRDLVVKSSLEVTNGNITVRQSFAEVIGEATQLENDLGALNKAYSEGKDVTRELANVTSTLAKIQANEATQSADQLRGRIDTLASSATLATEEMAKLRKESLLAQASALTALQTSRGTYDGVFRDADMTIQGEGGRFIPSNPATPTSRPNLLDFDQDKVKKERGGGKKNDDYKNETRSIREQTEALQAAYDAQSTLNVSVNDYGYAVAYAKAETDLLQAAQRDGKTVNSALKTEIAGLAESYAEATVQQAKLNEEQKKAKASIESAKSAMTGFLSTFQQGLRNGEGFWKSFGNAAMGILDKIISKLNDQVVDAIFSSFSGPSSSGGSGGGFLSGFISLFSAKGNAFTQGGNVKAFANGGVVNGATPFNYSGGLGVMGEAGPEAIMPLKRNGNGQLGVVAANSNNPVNAPVSITIDATGADAAGLARVEKRLAALQQTLPNTIVKTVKQAEARRAL